MACNISTVESRITGCSSLDLYLGLRGGASSRISRPSLFRAQAWWAWSVGAGACSSVYMPGIRLERLQGPKGLHPAAHCFSALHPDSIGRNRRVTTLISASAGPKCRRDCRRRLVKGTHLPLSRDASAQRLPISVSCDNSPERCPIQAPAAFLIPLCSSFSPPPSPVFPRPHMQLCSLSPYYVWPPRRLRTASWCPDVVPPCRRLSRHDRVHLRSRVHIGGYAERS